MSENQNYILRNGKLQYEVTPEVQKVLEGAMYWSHCQKLDTQELHIAEKEGSGYTEEEIKKLRFDVEGCDVTIRDIMNKMDELNVPNWVGNGALAFGRDNDLRNHYMSEFFESGKYSEKGQKKLREIHERD